MIRTLGNLKNIPLNTDLNTLFELEEEVGGYRCLYPNIRLNYPVNDTGYLMITKSKNIGEMLYVTKKSMYRRAFYIKNNSTKVITEWSKLSLGNNRREIKDLTTRGLMSYPEIRDIIRKYLIEYDPRPIRELLNRKADKSELNKYYNVTGGDIYESRRLANGLVVRNSGHYHTEIHTGIRYNFKPTPEGKGTPPTPVGHVYFYNNSDPGNGLAHHLYGQEMHNGQYRHMNIIGHYSDGNTCLIGDSWEDANIQRTYLRSEHHPYLESRSIPSSWNREIVTKEDLRWKMIYDGRAGIKDYTINFYDHVHEVIIQCYSDFNNGGYEDMEPLYFVPGHYCRVNYYHHTIVWNREGHNRVIIERSATVRRLTHGSHQGDSYDVYGSLSRSYCPICNGGDRQSRVGRYLGTHGHTPYTSFHNNVSIRRIWVR